MKKYLIGAVAGFLLAAPLYAAADTTLKQVTAYLRPDLPILLDGKQVELNNPPLIYEGSTYLPLKEFGAVVGKDVAWNAATQSVELGKAETAEKNITPSEDTLYGMPYIEVDGVIYFWIRDIELKYYGEGYAFKYQSEEKEIYLAYNPFPAHPVDKYEVISKAIPYETFKDKTCISKTTYESIVIPLIK